MTKTACLKIPKGYGEKAIILTKKLGVFNRDLMVQRIEGYLYIPLVSKPLPVHVEEFRKALPTFEVSVHAFPAKVKRPIKIIDILEDKLPPHLLASLPHAIDFIGDIAIIELLPELESHKNLVGEAILNAHKRVSTVLAKSSAVEGVFRVRKFEVIAGQSKTETIHKEHGCTYHVDVAKAYFSPRLSQEHNRVALQVNEGETTIDMFAGVGAFSILIAKKHENIRAYAVDVNPEAISYLEKNIVANRVQGKIIPILGDVRKVVKKQLVGVADRVIMNLPEKAIEYIDVACEALKPEGGIMHYYEFAKAPNPIETAQVRLTEAVKKANRGIEKILLAKTVRATAPFEWQIVVDTQIQ
jgi:tRNA (guanine37-N1)-methyltransferase